MNRLFPLLAMLGIWFCCQPVAAQFGIGAEAGLHLAYAKYVNNKPEVIGNTQYTGYYAGIIPAHRFGKLLSVSSPIHYSQRGFNIWNSVFRLRYLDLMPQLNLSPLSWLSLDAGFFGSRLLDETIFF